MLARVAFHGLQEELLVENTYNVSISLCLVMCFFPIERFDTKGQARAVARRLHLLVGILLLLLLERLRRCVHGR